MSATTAIPAQGTTLFIGTAATAISAITAITKANPAVVTKATHGAVTGQVMLMSAATGMTEINGRYGICRVLDVNTFELDGIDSTGFTTYSGSTGIATPSKIQVKGLKTFNKTTGAATQIDATDLDSTQKEQLAGLAGFSTFAITMQRIFTDPGQQCLLASSYASGVNSPLTLTVKGQTPVTTTGQCSHVDFQGGIDALLDGSADFVLSKDWA